MRICRSRVRKIQISSETVAGSLAKNSNFIKNRCMLATQGREPASPFTNYAPTPKRLLPYSLFYYYLVPGISNGWRGWSRKGKTGFLIHSNWLYFVSIARCPCRFKQPPLPQPGRPGGCKEGNCD